MKKYLALAALASVLAFGSTKASAQSEISLAGLGAVPAGVVVATVFVAGTLLYVVSNGDGSATVSTTTR